MDSVEVINIIFFTNIGPNLNDTLPASLDPNTICEPYLTLENIDLLSIEEVATLVKSINVYKSSGLPDINSRLMKDGFLALTDQLRFIMNLSLQTGIFPDEWKLATVTPIPKTGDLTNVNNIRPISLTALPGKLLEKHVHKKLVTFLEENKLLCDNQGGFRKNKSSTQTVFSLAVYLDIAKAFDSINHKLLLKKLQMIGIRGMYFNWLQSYMSDRKQVVINRGHRSTEHELLCGVPQGSIQILGPLLFIIYI